MKQHEKFPLDYLSTLIYNISMNKFRIKEIVSIYAMYKTLQYMSQNRDVPFIDAYRAVCRKDSDKSNDDLFNDDFYFEFCDASKAMMHELLVLLKEAHLEDIDFTHPEINNLVKKIKAKMPKDLATLDGEQLICSIRNLIAHNSSMVHNYHEYEFDKFQLSFNMKGKEKPILVDLDANDLVDIIFVIDRCKNRTLEVELDVGETYTMNTLLKARSRVNSYNDILSLNDKNKSPLEFDTYQDNALTRFLVKNTKIICQLERKRQDKYFHLARYAPFKANATNHYEQKSYNMLMLVDCANSGNMTYNEITDYMTKNFLHGALPLYDRETLDSLWFSTIAFNIVSMCTADDLEMLASQTQYKFTREQCRHIRNAFVHGRYFYNYHDGFELYDGKDGNLTHQMTIKANMIFELFKAGISETKKEMMSESTKTGLTDETEKV